MEYGGTLHGSGFPDEEPTTNLGSGSPTMPHLELRGQELDNAYPHCQSRRARSRRMSPTTRMTWCTSQASERQKRSDVRLLITAGNTE